MVTTLLPILGELVYNILILLFYNNLKTQVWETHLGLFILCFYG